MRFLKSEENLKRGLNGLIFLACLSFVLWQCYALIQKFIDRPTSTSVKIEYARDWPTPTFTICLRDDLGITKALERCKLGSHG